MSKSFSEKMKQRAAENPAMMFISQPDAEPEPEEAAPEVSRNPETGRNRLKVSSARMVETPEPEPIPEETTLLKAPRAPQRAEAKTRRLQLLLQPSLYEAVRARAEAEGLSVNEEIGELLRSALQR